MFKFFFELKIFAIDRRSVGDRPVNRDRRFAQACSRRTSFISRSTKKFIGIEKLFRKFRVVLSSGSHETGSTAKKVTASDSAKPGPYIFLGSGVTGVCVW